MKTKFLALSLTLLFVNGAQSAIVDNYSTNQAANYTFRPMFNNPADGWNVAGGELRPHIPGNATGGWLWENIILSTVGEVVSVDFWIASPNGSLGTAAGLLLANALINPTAVAEISLLTRGSGNSTLQVPGASRTVTQLQTGFSVLTLAMTGQNASTSTYSVQLAGGGLATYTSSFTLNSRTAYFGPVLYDSSSAGAVRFDNLSYQSVPEPSTVATLGLGLGLVMLAAAANSAAARALSIISTTNPTPVPGSKDS